MLHLPWNKTWLLLFHLILHQGTRWWCFFFNAPLQNFENKMKNENEKWKNTGWTFTTTWLDPSKGWLNLVLVEYGKGTERVENFGVGGFAKNRILCEVNQTMPLASSFSPDLIYLICLCVWFVCLIKEKEKKEEKLLFIYKFNWNLYIHECSFMRWHIRIAMLIS